MSTTLIQIPHLEVRRSELHGYGVFATEPIPADTVVEECLTLGGVIWELDSFNDAMLSYVYSGPADSGNKSFVAFGYGSLYNHSHRPNLKTTWVEREGRTILILTTVRRVEAGEELRHSYGRGYWHQQAERAADRLRQLRALEGNAPESEGRSEIQALQVHIERCLEESEKASLRSGLDRQATAVSALHKRFDASVRSLDERTRRMASRVRRKQKTLTEAESRLARNLVAIGAESMKLGSVVNAMRTDPKDTSGGETVFPFWRIGAGSVGRYGLTFDDQEMHPELPGEKTVILQSGDLLLALEGDSRGMLGRVPADAGNLVANSSVLVLRPDPTKIHSEYLWELLRLQSNLTPSDSDIDLAVHVLQLEIDIPSVERQSQCLKKLRSSEGRLKPFIERVRYELRAAELVLEELEQSRKTFTAMHEAALVTLRPFIDVESSS
ncbi:MAG: SET domain-containing protein-lysine N-methyltransferase [Myxococcota bacterium]